MALSDERIDDLAEDGVFLGNVYEIAQAIEAEVRKQDEALIRQLLEALENSSDLVFKNPRKADARDAAITAARTRLGS